MEKGIDVKLPMVFTVRMTNNAAILKADFLHPALPNHRTLRKMDCVSHVVVYTMTDDGLWFDSDVAHFFGPECSGKVYRYLRRMVATGNLTRVGIKIGEEGDVVIWRKEDQE